jgi:hypothetical protein
MNLGRNQQGMTFLGWVIVLVLVGGIALIVMKLVPLYMESFKVDSALKSIVEQPNLKDESTADIYKQFVRRMNVEDVNRFNDRNVRKFVTVDKKGPHVTITVEYQAKAELYDNLSLVADFKKQASNP